MAVGRPSYEQSPAAARHSTGPYALPTQRSSEWDAPETTPIQVVDRQPRQAQAAPVPAAPRRRWPAAAAGLAAGLLIGAAIGSAGSGSAAVSPVAAPATGPAAAAPVQTREVPVTVVPPAAAQPADDAASSSVGDGVHQVGTDIAPGRWRTAGPSSSAIVPNCYYARLRTDSGEFGAIIANGNLQGPGSVTLRKGEFVEFSGGCTWAPA